MQTKKILIVGHGRHGKDLSAVMLASITGLRYAGSCSWAVLPLMADYLNIHPQQAWEERHNQRGLWKNHCDELRRYNPARLVATALKSGNIVTGCRQLIELTAARKQRLVDLVVWVERPNFPTDPTLDFSANDADAIVVNDGTQEQLHETLTKFAEHHGLL